MNSNINISSLNEKQQEAVVSREKRLPVLAGAGSGKTMRLLQKIVYLIEKEKLFLISQKGNESGFIGEISESLLERIDKPVELFADKVILCSKCQKQIEESNNFCPHSGNKITIQ